MDDFDDLFEIYPKCKVIFISVTLQDVPRIKRNIFYKIPKYKGIKFDQTRYDDILIDDGFINLDLKCPVKYSKNVNVIPMYDIIHHKNKTLMLLSQITKQPITEKIIEIYNTYLNAQDTLIKTKLPWVRV